MSAQQNRARTMTGAGRSAGAPVPAHVSTRKERAAGIDDVEKVLSNWCGNAVSHPAKVVQPQSIKQIAQIMLDQKTFPSPVRAVGSNQSPTRCAVVDAGTIIDTRKLDGILKIDNESVTVQAGVLYKDLVHRLHAEGLQLPVAVDFGNFTMGSAACGLVKGFGPPGQPSLLSSYVLSMMLITPAGKELVISDDKPDLLRVARSCYGLMGIVYEATFKVVPLENRFVELTRMRLDDFVGSFPDIADTSESVRFHMYPFREEIVVEKWTSVTNYPPRRDRLWKLLNWLDVYALPGLAFILKKTFPFSRIRHGLIDRAAVGLQNMRCRFTNRIGVGVRAFIKPYAAKSRPWTRFTYSAWAFPAMSYDIVLDAYFRFCRDYADMRGYRNDLPTLGCRIEQDTDSFLSPSMSGTVFTIEPLASDTSGWDDFLIDFNDFCSQHGGIPFFNHTPALTPKQARSSFGERLNSFRLLRQKVDPHNRLANQYFLQLLK